MSDAILVLNAGSSSIKFSLFLERNGNLAPGVRGQIEGLYTKAHFVAKAPDGTVTAETLWPDDAKPGHDGALDHLIGYLRSELADDRLVGVSGISSDMRALLSSQDPRAGRAVDLFVYQIRRNLGSLAADLGGIDAIDFVYPLQRDSG
jgi:acetate kinase